jgi:hypothetical protein
VRVQYTTKFGSLTDYQKGGIDLIDDDPKRYAFSNIFEVASAAAPYEKVAVGKNMQYVLEAIRAEGTAEWRTCAHDEFALVLDGEVEVRLMRLDTPAATPGKRGSVRLDGEPTGVPMGRVVARRGHMVLLPANAAYRFHADRPGVILLQTILGDDTVERWAEICLS